MPSLKRAERFDEVLDVLVRAGQTLTASSNVAAALADVVRLCVPSIADFCAIEAELDPAAPPLVVQAGEPAAAAAAIAEALYAGRRTLGSIEFRTASEEGFDATAQRAIKLLAAQIAVVVTADISAKREHRVADRLQRALLPGALPDVPATRLFASYRPASEEADVGGDWFDAFSLSDNRLAISVGDVAGHGLEAAVIMGEVRQAIRTAAARNGTSPVDVIEDVNDAIRLRERAGMVTAIFALYDPASGVLTYACAGHPWPLLILGSGTARRLPGGGVPLGCCDSVDSYAWTVTLPPGARIAFYTDGLIENDRDVVGGEARLLEVATGLGDAADPAEAIADRVFEGVSNRDDAAILVLERLDPVREYVFSAIPTVAAVSRAIVNEAIAALPLDRERRFGVALSVSEAIANAVEHGYRGLDPGLIRLAIEIDAAHLTITVEDYGRWRPAVRREERGRGLALMHAFMDGVRINSTSEATAIVLRLDLGAPSKAVV